MKIIQFKGDEYVYKKTKINWKYIFLKEVCKSKT